MSRMQLYFSIGQNDFQDFFFVFSGVATSVGRPGRSASSVFVRPRLKSAYHRQMVVFDREFSR